MHLVRGAREEGGLEDEGCAADHYWRWGGSA
jgi:hypothetical protein